MARQSVLPGLFLPGGLGVLMPEKTRVLITNDDGIDAPGLSAVADAVAARDNTDVWIAAPDKERSTCSNGMTLGRPVFVQSRGAQRFAVDGLPVDCVYLAAYGLMPTPPDVVISGINHGPNLGTDVIFSGTVAGARQAAMQGIHGVAASLIAGRDFSRAAEAVADIALALARAPATPPQVLNLNFPKGAFKGPKICPLGERHYPRVVSERTAPLTRETYYWLGGPAVEDQLVEGSDGWLIANGTATLTPLRIDQTDADAMDALTKLSLPLIETA